MKTIFKYQREDGDYLTIDLPSIATTFCSSGHKNVLGFDRVLNIYLKNSSLTYTLLENEIDAFYKDYIPFIDAWNKGGI